MKENTLLAPKKDMCSFQELKKKKKNHPNGLPSKGTLSSFPMNEQMNGVWVAKRDTDTKGSTTSYIPTTGMQMLSP